MANSLEQLKATGTVGPSCHYPTKPLVGERSLAFSLGTTGVATSWFAPGAAGWGFKAVGIRVLTMLLDDRSLSVILVSCSLDDPLSKTPR